MRLAVALLLGVLEGEAPSVRLPVALLLGVVEGEAPSVRLAVELTGQPAHYNPARKLSVAAGTVLGAEGATLAGGGCDRRTLTSRSEGA